VPEGALGLLKAANVASARMFGLEASTRLRVFGFDLRLAYTGLLTFNDDPSACPTCTTSPPLLGRPAHDFVGDVTYARGPFRVRYGLDAIASLYADTRGEIRVPDRVLQSIGARADIPWVRGLRVAADVSNLFDVRTGLASGFQGVQTREPIGDQFNYPLPGRTFLATARWQLGAANASE
jgi:outer membrane receptor protein involved in Fe transport